ncbi:MFS transporter [Burkholderia gladioli]|uniref:MFS transporter n=1 Tax=Burkholderia gladioli TaxID=28095 RepID=UPI001ABBCE27|nr:MFS transporter [Burkholderia gladioli]MBU9174080.1 MFS transporter [Burkholderia gladioli]
MDFSSAHSLSADGGPPASEPSSRLSPARAAIAVLALSLGCFCFVSTELMPVGVLPAMAAGLGVSLGEAGYLVSCFAFVVALSAMPLTGLLGGLDRKLLMAALLAVCAAGNVLTYLAPGYPIVLAGRILVAAAIAVFWSTAVVTAVQLVAPKHAVRATSVVFGGVSLAAVLGIPAGTLLGEHAGWRAVFAALTILSLVVFAAVLGSVPRLRVAKASIRGAMPAVLRDGPLLGLLACTALVVTGNFLGYTYVTPYLEQAAHLAPGRISMMLLVYGAAGVLGNFAVGPLARHAPRTGLALATSLLAASLAAMHLAVASQAATVALLAGWGAAYGALPVLLQTSVFEQAARIEGGAEAATPANVAVFNAGVGLGALIGGVLVNRLGPAPIPGVAAAFVLAGLLVVVAMRGPCVGGTAR